MEISFEFFKFFWGGKGGWGGDGGEAAHQDIPHGSPWQKLTLPAGGL